MGGLRRLWRAEAGGSLIEYGLVLGTIGAAIAAIFLFGDTTRGIMSHLAYCVIDLAC